MDELSKIEVVRELPYSIGGHPQPSGDLMKVICGSKIVSFGAPASHAVGSQLEGGGLIIDFVPEGSEQVTRVVLAFNECGMWVEYYGNLTANSS